MLAESPKYLRVQKISVIMPKITVKRHRIAQSSIAEGLGLAKKI
jgi:hypothetical protein